MDLLILLLVLIIAIVIYQLFVVGKQYALVNPTGSTRENFEMCEPSAGNPFCLPLGMPRDRYLPDGQGCASLAEALEGSGSNPLCSGKDVPPAGPIVSATCNRIPLEKVGMTPVSCQGPDYDIKEPPFPAPTKDKGQYTFCIPQWKYDGVWSREMDPTNPSQCCWTLQDQPKECGPYKTYGGEHLSRTPQCSMYGKTIISPPECAGLWPDYKPPITYIYDCAQDLPCDARRGIKCPTRV
jgi:hypothetical protein